VADGVSSWTTTCRIAAAQPMSAVWPLWNCGGDGAGAWLGWVGGVGAGWVVLGGVGVVGSVGFDVGVGHGAGAWLGGVGGVGAGWVVVVVVVVLGGVGVLGASVVGWFAPSVGFSVGPVGDDGRDGEVGDGVGGVGVLTGVVLTGGTDACGVAGGTKVGRTG